jgi:hypothetical protein
MPRYAALIFYKFNGTSVEIEEAYWVLNKSIRKHMRFLDADLRKIKNVDNEFKNVVPILYGSNNSKNIKKILKRL